MTACPSGVEYNKLIEPTRAQIERKLPRSAADWLMRKMLFATFPHSARLRLLTLPLLVYQRSGCRAVVRGSGIPEAGCRSGCGAMEAPMPASLKPEAARAPGNSQA